MERQPRPVNVLRLTSVRPQELARHTGTVSSWKTDQMGFQVGGRVQQLLEPGTNIEGATFDENGDPLNERTIVAVLEKERFEYQLQSAMANVNTAIAQRDAADFELNNVLPQQIEAAQARQALAQTNFNRTQQLVSDGTAAQSELDRATASLDVATADLQQLLETRAIREAERAGYQDQVDEAQEAVRSAQKDLDDTVLRSPYGGQVSEVHQILGGVVQPGQAVCTVQMMDPIAIEVQVSARQDALLNYNDMVQVFPPGTEVGQEAMVYEKAALADPATRTYAVTLLMRNDIIKVGFPDDFDDENDARVRNLWGIFTETPQRRPPYFVCTDALHQDDAGYFVWRATELDRSDHVGNYDSQIAVDKDYVIPGDRRISFPGVAVLRELQDLSELDPEQALIVGAPRDGEGRLLPEDEAMRRVESNGYVYFVRDRWELRPGDVVQVELRGEDLQQGIYVPMNAVSQTAGGTFVFVVDESTSPPTARRIAVTATPVPERPEYVRVESASSDAIVEGTQIVLGGVHYLVDGEPIRIAGRVEARL